MFTVLCCNAEMTVVGMLQGAMGSRPGHPSVIDDPAEMRSTKYR
jgi:hypothetical protein